jgi:hypothetical protein
VTATTTNVVDPTHREPPLTGDDGPNWLNDPTLALSLSMVVHIWK